MKLENTSVTSKYPLRDCDFEVFLPMCCFMALASFLAKRWGFYFSRNEYAQVQDDWGFEGVWFRFREPSSISFSITVKGPHFVIVRACH